MVENKQIISGIDIGTTKIAVVIAEWIKQENKINIAILLGDPSGIGPELVSKLLSEEITNKANIIVIGEKNILENGNKISGKSHNLKFVESFDQKEKKKTI